MEGKKKIYLTDIRLHSKESRATLNFSHAEEIGRIYSPIEADQLTTTAFDKNNFRMQISVPSDLQEMIDRGEVEIMVPNDGLNIYAGKDLEEFIVSKNGKRILRKLAKD